ncbi:prolyl oligopeptidase family serine peptidase [Paenibacillus sp. IB182496]|uniref:Prolyl oligopeptidase family serine peptidase n=1 Tax=Paenibacillus sabuli TaxID=2772509 RepID=A0A927BSE6_9BACL|nr:prolyl oligopeptidase family serine peptidase [Paenibacillus sabuli]MBD2845923.1 prolyl oligopeptidase family serine peptidase [Paenibacillus sabuli]
MEKKDLNKNTKTDSKNLVNIPKFTFNTNRDYKFLEKGLYSFEIDRIKYDFLFSPGEEKRLFVFFNGDFDRNKYTPPVFQRWSWASHFPGHCIYISDPSLNLCKNVGLAWYIGTKQISFTEKITMLVRKVAQITRVNEEDIVFYGSSGGGFASLFISKNFPAALTVAINPQIDLTRYYQNKVNDFLNELFDGFNIDDIKKYYYNRFSILEHSKELISQRIIYAQNKLDKHHYNNHFKPFCKKMDLKLESGKENNIFKILFEHPEGHKRAETPEVFKEIMNYVINT